MFPKGQREEEECNGLGSDGSAVYKVIESQNTLLYFTEVTCMWQLQKCFSIRI